MTSALLAFDKLAYIDRLKGSGIEDGQARAHAEALDVALRDSVATKSDVDRLRNEVQTSITLLRNEVQASVTLLRNEVQASISTLRNETQSHIDLLRRDLQASEIRLEAKIETAMAGVKVDILRWLLMTQVALAGFIFAMLKFLH